MPEKRVVRLLLQQCTSAQLDLSRVQPDAETPGETAGADPTLEQPDDDGVLRVGCHTFAHRDVLRAAQIAYSRSSASTFDG